VLVCEDCLAAQTSKESLRCPLCKPAREAGGAEAEVAAPRKKKRK